MARLVAIMAQLRSPDGGCPWDLEQDFASIAPCTIEEAYEVADAAARGDMADLKGELGDLLFQVVFYAQLAAERGHFDFDGVAAAIGDKMIKRHPHVFGDADIKTSADQMAAWEAQKAEERTAAGAESALDGVALGLPALMRAQKLQSRAAKTGFEWQNVEHVLAKLDEEIGEVKEAIAHQPQDQDHIAEEIGDVLFVTTVLARKLGFDAETLMRAANEKFIRRFKNMEKLSSDENSIFNDLSPESKLSLWQKAKKIV